MTDQNSTATEPGLKLAFGLSIGTKSVVLAYVLWFFLGALGAHRIYLGRAVTGVIMAVLTIVGLSNLVIYIGIIPLFAVLIWWVADFFLILIAAIKRNSNQKRLTG